jgi:UDP-glucose 4-epimerase
MTHGASPNHGLCPVSVSFYRPRESPCKCFGCIVLEWLPETHLIPRVLRVHVLAPALLDNGDTIAVNLGTGHGASRLALRITGREIVSRDASRRAGDPPVLVADAKTAGEVLGWAPQYSDLAAIIADAWRWHNKIFGNKSL